MARPKCVLCNKHPLWPGYIRCLPCAVALVDRQERDNGSVDVTAMYYGYTHKPKPW